MKKLLFIFLLLTINMLSYSRELKDAKVGDYVYSNGKVLDNRYNNDGECIGVVISVTPTEEQIELGYFYGTFVLLEDLPGTYSFFLSETSFKVPELPGYWSTTDLKTLMGDRNGHKYTYSFLLSNSNAAQACENADVSGDFHSKCFIPTPGQWYEMLVNIGLADIDDNRHINNAETVASRLNSIIGGFNKDDRNTPSHERNKYWLAAQSFNGECGWCGRTDYVGYNNFHVNLNEKYRYGVSSPGLMDGKTKKRRIRPMCYF